MTRRRWLAGLLALVLAAAAAWALATWTRPPGPEGRSGAGERGEPPAGEDPHADIDEASRERLREVLREEDAREARERRREGEGER